MKMVVTGNEAAAWGARLSRPKVICAYPITPQSHIPETLSEWCAQGLLKAKFVNVESEYGALGYLLGASSGGVRTFTATSSLGLGLMHEELQWAAGIRLPIVMAVANRSLGGGSGVGCDQGDSLAQRDTGWLQFYCESNQEVVDTIIQAYKVAETVSLPAMVCLDGIYLSYILESTDIPEQEKVDAYLPPYEPQFTVLGMSHKMYHKYREQVPSGRQGYMQERYEMHKWENRSLKAILAANEEFREIFGRGYLPVEEYKCDDADIVVVNSGSTVGTCKTVIDKMRQEGHKIGLVKLKTFRPFPGEMVRKALAGRKKIAVIERSISPGQGGIWCQEIRTALTTNQKREFAPVYGFVAGLGGGWGGQHIGDITPELIEKAILYTIKTEPPQQDVIWLGLRGSEHVDDYDRNAIKVL
ncbi:MAG: pyruvate ferredoxin oxidoreductase [Chloroflexi bacterium]|nr:pyruvate ferredoxin oxidoreductase [Chloroflexota bacterium]